MFYNNANKIPITQPNTIAIAIIMKVFQLKSGGDMESKATLNSEAD